MRVGILVTRLIDTRLNRIRSDPRLIYGPTITEPREESERPDTQILLYHQTPLRSRLRHLSDLAQCILANLVFL